MIIRYLPRKDYLTTWQAMREFTQTRTQHTEDEIWLLEHNSVFTQGQNGKPEHLLNKNSTPVIETDRGGQITWHGPGQLIAYTLINLKRHKLNTRTLVSTLENTIIKLLAEYNLNATSNSKAPGVYIDNKKIASIGLRIKRGCAYHGLAFNINPDLSPFNQINPCGFSGLKMTKLADYIDKVSMDKVKTRLAELLITELSYNGNVRAYVGEGMCQK